MITVKDLIKYLQTQPSDLPVCYDIHSEHCLLEYNDIMILELCEARPDGWVHDKRPDKSSRPYLVLP